MTLAHLANQSASAGEWEVVVVDNASGDGTAEVAQRVWASLGEPVPLRVLHEPIPGIANARRAALLGTSAPFVLFCDDDNWLEPSYVEVATQRLAAGVGIGALGGQSSPALEGGSSIPDWLARDPNAFAVGVQGAASGDVSDRGYLWGAGLAVRAAPIREFFRRGGKFALQGRTRGRLLSGDDSELCYWLLLLGYELHYEETLSFRHYIPLSRQVRQYYVGLHKGFSSARPILNAYRAELRWLSRRGPNPFPHKFLQVVKDAVVSMAYRGTINHNLKILAGMRRNYALEATDDHVA